MAQPDGRPSPFGVLVILLVLAAVAIVLCEQATRSALAETRAGALSDDTRRMGGFLRSYLAVRMHVLANWFVYVPLLVVGPPLLLRGLRRMAAASSAFRERFAGMAFERAGYGLAHPFDRTPDRLLVRTQAALAAAVAANPAPDDQVVLGLDSAAAPVYLADRARSMHVHLLGQTGSGKTQSVIYPLLFQDALRRRPVLFLDAKGSVDNELFLAEVAAATGTSLKLLSLNPHRPSSTYNPVHLEPNADPRAVAERLFSTFAGDMDVPYFRDLARDLLLNLVAALASTGKRFCIRDLAACVGDAEVRWHALTLASDRRAVRFIENTMNEFGDKFGEKYSGLLSALNRYDHPAVNAYDPDIILERDLAEGTIVGFSLSANAYKFLAPAIGIMVLQHLQQLGAARQMNRGLSQAPLYVYADEFYSFAYEGFVDALNKLRDANVSLLLSHQSLADLLRVSPEYAQAVWDNTRNKIVLYQNDSEVCDRLAASLGTRKNVELTVRRNADGWLNQRSMLEASSREVDEFVLHPSQPKNLRVGQCYLVQAGVGTPSAAATSWWRRPAPVEAPAVAVGTNLAMMPPLPTVDLPVAEPRRGDGLFLYELFVESPCG